MIMVTKWKSIQLKEQEAKPSSRQLKSKTTNNRILQHQGQRGVSFSLLLILQDFLQLSQ